MVTDDDRAIAGVLLDPAIKDDFELIPTSINGIDCAALMHVTVCLEHGVTMRPAALILNPRLFGQLKLPDDAEIFREGE